MLPRPQRISPPWPPGSLLKRAREERRAHKPVKTHDTDAPYLALVRDLPCLRCGVEPAGCAAHVRMSSAALAKTQGLARKPHDRWTVPLCWGCHTHDPDSQHRVGEQEFWARVGLNPLLVCVALHDVAGDVVAMRAVALGAIGSRS